MHGSCTPRKGAAVMDWCGRRFFFFFFFFCILWQDLLKGGAVGIFSKKKRSQKSKTGAVDSKGQLINLVWPNTKITISRYIMDPSNIYHGISHGLCRPSTQ